jgi:hypothetical protein
MTIGRLVGLTEVHLADEWHPDPNWFILCALCVLLFNHFLFRLNRRIRIIPPRVPFWSRAFRVYARVMKHGFPGVDPFLEDPAFRRDFHESFVVYTRDSNSALLPDSYSALVGATI